MYCTLDNDCAYCLLCSAVSIKSKLQVINIIYGVSGVIRNDKSEIMKLLETDWIILLILEKSTHDHCIIWKVVFEKTTIYKLCLQ